MVDVDSHSRAIARGGQEFTFAVSRGVAVDGEGPAEPVQMRCINRVPL